MAAGIAATGAGKIGALLVRRCHLHHVGRGRCNKEVLSFTLSVVKEWSATPPCDAGAQTLLRQRWRVFMNMALIEKATMRGGGAKTQTPSVTCWRQ